MQHYAHFQLLLNCPLMKNDYEGRWFMKGKPMDVSSSYKLHVSLSVLNDANVWPILRPFEGRPLITAPSVCLLMVLCAPALPRPLQQAWAAWLRDLCTRASLQRRTSHWFQNRCSFWFCFKWLFFSLFTPRGGWRRIQKERQQEGKGKKELSVAPSSYGATAVQVYLSYENLQAISWSPQMTLKCSKGVFAIQHESKLW